MLEEEKLKEVFSAWLMKLRSEYQFCRETSSAARSVRGINLTFLVSKGLLCLYEKFLVKKLSVSPK